MKRIVTSRRVRHMVLWLQWLLLLGSLPLSSTAQNLPEQMEMRAADRTAMPTSNAPAADCRSFAFCCIAPPVPVRAFGTPERSDQEFGTDAWQRESNGHTVVAMSRPLAPPSVVLRVLYCCWRN